MKDFEEDCKKVGEKWNKEKSFLIKIDLNN
jgi:hypothetical protein